MNEFDTYHSSFTVDRSYPFPPARVFAAWASAEAKARWFAGPEDWTQLHRELDFRVGGRERVDGRRAGQVSSFNSIYQDIVQDRRIVYSYDMETDGKRMSVSLATVEFRPAGTGTQLVITEQGVFLNGNGKDYADGRESGTRFLMEQLAAALR